MPSAESILEGLTALANRWFVLAVAWHALFGAALLALALGWRPSRRAAGLLLALPLVSVSVAAWAHANPFNGAVFAALAIALAILALRLPRDPVAAAPRLALAIASLLIVFAWVYPHFLSGRPAYAYLYGAPVGLVPCPTLSMVIGLALAGGGLGQRAFGAVLAAAGVFYGLFGMFRLGVSIDLGLLAGAVALAALVAWPTQGRRVPTSAPAA